jgi:FkbM family methyltransferase
MLTRWAKDKLLSEDSALGSLVRETWRRLTPHRSRAAIPIVLAAFARERRGVFFIQVGSNDGSHNDPLRAHLLRHGWSGIMVEPVPYVFERLRANYGAQKGVRLEQVAIGPVEGPIPFYHLAQTDEALPQWYDQLGSFLRENIVKHADQIPRLEERILETMVQSMTFRSLCRKHDVRKIDLLHIDAEGFDYEVIKTVDFGLYAPDVLLYEHKHLSASDLAACEALLRSHDYECLSDGADTICLRRGASGARLRRVFRMMTRARALSVQ